MKFARQMTSLEKAIAALPWTPTGDGPAGEAISAWCAYTGQSEHEAANWGWLSALHPNDREQAMQGWIRAVQTQHMHTTYYHVRRYDGSYALFQVRAIPYFRPDH